MRREKVLNFGGCNSRPAIQPEAVRATEEVTNLSKPLMKRITWWANEQAGRNVRDR